MEPATDTAKITSIPSSTIDKSAWTTVNTSDHHASEVASAAASGYQAAFEAFQNGASKQKALDASNDAIDAAADAADIALAAIDVGAELLDLPGTEVLDLFSYYFVHPKQTTLVTVVNATPHELHVATDTKTDKELIYLHGAVRGATSVIPAAAQTTDAYASVGAFLFDSHTVGTGGCSGAFTAKAYGSPSPVFAQIGWLFSFDDPTPQCAVAVNGHHVSAKDGGAHGFYKQKVKSAGSVNTSSDGGVSVRAQIQALPFVGNGLTAATMLVTIQAS